MWGVKLVDILRELQCVAGAGITILGSAHRINRWYKGTCDETLFSTQLRGGREGLELAAVHLRTFWPSLYTLPF